MLLATGALRPGALFVVGDPKQSIYRFRRADIDIYNEVRARLGGPDGSGHRAAHDQLPIGARPVRLGERRLQGSVSGGADAAGADVRAARCASRRRRRGVRTIAVLDLPATIDAQRRCRRGGARIARYIRAEVDAGRRELRRLPDPHAQEEGAAAVRRRARGAAGADRGHRRRRVRRVGGGARDSRCCSARSPIRRMPSRSSASCAGRSSV